MAHPMSSLFVLLPAAHASPHTEFEYVLSADGRAARAPARAAAAWWPRPAGGGS